MGEQPEITLTPQLVLTPLLHYVFKSRVADRSGFLRVPRARQGCKLGPFYNPKNLAGGGILLVRKGPKFA